MFFNSMNFYTKGKLDYYKSISLTDFHAIPMMLNFMNIHEMSRRRVNNMATSIFSNDLPSKFIQTNLHNTKTKEGTENACNILKDFCAARGEVRGQIESLNEKELGELLCDFYANVRSKDGEIYKKSSMPAIRSGLNRHLKTPPHSKPFTIITDPALVQTMSSKQCLGKYSLKAREVFNCYQKHYQLQVLMALLCINKMHNIPSM